MEHPSENPAERAAWRKYIFREMFKGLKKPHFQEKTWEILYNKGAKEYSFIVGNTILFIDENGNPESVKILENGRVRPSTQITKMAILLDHALHHYAQKNNIKFSGSVEEKEEDELQGIAVDVEKNRKEEPQKPAEGIIKKIRKKLKRTSV